MSIKQKIYLLLYLSISLFFAYIYWLRKPYFSYGSYWRRSMSDITDFKYKCTDFYNPEYERSLMWNDSVINIG